MTPTLLIIPGLGDSGPEHWQTYWSNKFPNAVRVQQDNWDAPRLEEWLERLDQIIQAQRSPIVLVAHSLAVSLVLHWVQSYSSKKVAGAMLVSTSDVEMPEYTPEVVRNFSPMPLQTLPFPAVVVASEDDSFVAIDRAAFFAQKWGSDFVNIGLVGHINADSKLGEWIEGQAILDGLLKKISATA